MEEGKEGGGGEGGGGEGGGSFYICKFIQMSCPFTNNIILCLHEKFICRHEVFFLF